MATGQAPRYFSIRILILKNNTQRTKSRRCFGLLLSNAQLHRKGPGSMVDALGLYPGGLSRDALRFQLINFYLASSGQR